MTKIIARFIAAVGVAILRVALSTGWVKQSMRDEVIETIALYDRKTRAEELAEIDRLYNRLPPEKQEQADRFLERLAK